MQEVIELSRKVIVDCPFIQIGDNFITYGYREQGIPPEILSIVIQIESFQGDGTRNSSGGGGAGGGSGSYGVCASPTEVLSDVFDQDGKPIRTSSPAMKENDSFFIQYNCISGDLREAAELAAQVNHALILSEIDGVSFTIADKGVEYDVDGYNCFVSARIRIDKSVLYAIDYTNEDSIPIPYTIEWNFDHPVFWPLVNTYPEVKIKDINGNVLDPDDYYFDVDELYYMWTDGTYKTPTKNFGFKVYDLDEDGYGLTVPDGTELLSGVTIANTTENSGYIPYEEIQYPFRYIWNVKTRRKGESVDYPLLETQVTLDWSVWDKPPVTGFIPGQYYFDANGNDVNKVNINTTTYLKMKLYGLSAQTPWFQDFDTEPYQFAVVESQTVTIRGDNPLTGYYVIWGTAELNVTAQPQIDAVDYEDYINTYGQFTSFNNTTDFGYAPGTTIALDYDFALKWYDSEGNMIVQSYSRVKMATVV